MLFSSLEFLYLFLPLTIAAYFLSPRKVRTYVLLVSSIVFYGIAQPELLLLMLTVTLFDFFAGAAISSLIRRERSRAADAVCAVTVILNVLVLFVFKYLDAVLRAVGLTPLGIVLPVGISFYIFQAISYVIDVKRRSVEAQKNPFLFLTYVTFFPQLIAGPIVKYTDVEGRLAERKTSLNGFAEGLRLFTVGLSKKSILANGAGESFERLVRYSVEGRGTLIGAWLGLIFFAFQIYFDFSGYTDMARGLGKLFGFDFPENFRYPYTSVSITDFWRRWHVTLSSFFREYVYIPLGGNRSGRLKTYRNLLVTWLLTGLWHGASIGFVLWGLYFFVILAVEKAYLLRWLSRVPVLLSHIYSIFFILLGWLIFSCDGDTMTLSEGARYFSELFCIGCSVTNADVTLEATRGIFFLAVMSVGSTPLPAICVRKLRNKSEGAAEGILSVLSVVALFVCTCYLADSGYNPFLYFRF